MKWTLQQLLKINKFPLEFDFEIDFKEDIKDIEDIYDIEPTKVSGKLYLVDDNAYRIVYHIDTVLTLQCSLTLEPVDYHFEEDYDDIFSTNPDDDAYPIENNTLDLRQIVWSNIIIDKPISVTRDDAYEILEKRGIKLGEEPILDESETVLSYSDGRSTESEDEN